MSGRLLHFAGRHVGKSALPLAAIPFKWLRIYDDSAGKPAAASDPALGNLLLEIDLTGSTWVGTTSVALSSTIQGQVQSLGFALYGRLVSADGLTVLQQDYALPPNVTDPSVVIEEDNEPDSSFLMAPGPWQPQTWVEFGPGDVVYVP